MLTVLAVKGIKTMHVRLIEVRIEEAPQNIRYLGLVLDL